MVPACDIIINSVRKRLFTLPRPYATGWAVQWADTKIIFQDIDGCLNPDDGEHFSVIPGERLSLRQASMLGAINEAVEASPIEHFVLNSGRPWSLVHRQESNSHIRQCRFAERFESA